MPGSFEGNPNFEGKFDAYQNLKCGYTVTDTLFSLMFYILNFFLAWDL